MNKCDVLQFCKTFGFTSLLLLVNLFGRALWLHILYFLLADGILMMEVDRVLRPGGYWVLSGPPINWKTNYKAWQRPKEELQEEQRKIEDIAKRLCWEKKSEKGETAIWQKRMDADSCRSEQEDSAATFCKSADPDDVWYVIILNSSVLYVGSSSVLQENAKENVLLASHEWQILCYCNQGFLFCCLKETRLCHQC